MATRDPDKSARNRIIVRLTYELNDLLPEVEKETDISGAKSLNAKIGSLHDKFFDLKNDVIHSDGEFINRWLQGLNNAVAQDLGPRFHRMKQYARGHAFQKYLNLFLRRSYLLHFDEWSKNRPKVSESEIWIGQNNADYGLLVTPRFVNDEWENDKSEIRAFRHGYWTIGHVLATGFVIPRKNSRMTFESVEKYLDFFQHVLVRNSGSQHEQEIARHYVDYVNSVADPLEVPLLIPEFRYLGKNAKHIYRLDFMVINPFTLSRIGFELSPWATHGRLTGCNKKTQKQINKEAQANFEKEAQKLRSYFQSHGVFTLIFTDSQLSDTKKLFDQNIKPLLQPEAPTAQLSFEVMEEFL